MLRRVGLHLTSVAIPAFLGACSGDAKNSPFQPIGESAQVRVVNAAASDVAVSVKGVIVSASLAYGQGTGCFTANSTTSDIVIQSGSKTLTYGPNGLDFIPGETAQLVVTNYDSAVFQAIRVPVETTSTGGLARLLVLNVSGSATYDVYVTGIAAALGSPIATGLSTGVLRTPFTVPLGQQQVRLTDSGTQTVLMDLGNREWITNDRQLLLVAPPASGASTPRAFFWTASGCT